MSRNRFIHLVRAYVREARRGKRTYPEMVATLLSLYVRFYEQESDTHEQDVKEIEWARSFVKREYGSVDKSFSIEEAG